MKKLAIFMMLVLAMSTAVLANPVFADRGAEASNPLYQGIGGGDCDDTRATTPPGLEKVCTMTWIDSDSDGDGISDLTLESTELVVTNNGQIISAVKAEKKPKFKAGAELSKTVNSLNTGDLDGDGFADIAIGAERNGETVEITGIEISKRDARKGFYQTETHMNKAELIEAMASKAGLSKADSKKALDGFIKTVSTETPREK